MIVPCKRNRQELSEAICLFVRPVANKDVGEKPTFVANLVLPIDHRICFLFQVKSNACLFL